MRKVWDFLRACPKFSQAEKEQFSQEHLNDPKKAKHLSDAMVLILDKLDDMEKPEMVAKVFAALVRRKIELETFRRLAAAIDIGFVADLRALANDPRQAQGATEAYLPNLLRTGLAEIHDAVETSSATWSGEGYKLIFKVSILGKFFVGCMNQTYDFKI